MPGICTLPEVPREKYISYPQGALILIRMTYYQLDESQCLTYHKTEKYTQISFCSEGSNNSRKLLARRGQSWLGTASQRAVLSFGFELRLYPVKQLLGIGNCVIRGMEKLEDLLCLGSEGIC